MPVTLKLSFPAGRYHATPWGRHVNEGVPEWPPSPWRLLRALVAVWKRTCPDIPDDLVLCALKPLLQPPVYCLPPFRVAHTRHYMPWEKKGPDDRTLVFDTFVAVSRSESLLVGWPHAEPVAGDRATLERLVRNLTTLGRAEGWVDAELVEEVADWNCRPASSDDQNPVSVFCPDPATAFDDEHYPTHDAKKLKKGLKPADLLFDCPRWHLCLDTQTIHDRKWPRVPGSTWINYTRPIEASAPRSTSPVARRPPPTVVRLLIDGPVLPLVTDTIRIAEVFRCAAMSRFQGWCERNLGKAERHRRTNLPDDESRPQFSSKILSGKDSAGQILTSHGHAYYVPTSEGADRRRITRVTVFARDGFGEGELAAFSAMHWLGSPEDGLRVQLIGQGSESDFPSPIFESSMTWISATPYLGPAHIGLHGQGRYIRKAVRREWRRLSQQLPQYAGIELRDVMELTPTDVVRSGRPMPMEFRRARLKHGGAYRPGRFLRLVFSQPIRGPLCLGYASHFGLGLFVPQD